ncbi:MAG TPA: hypothetical protein DCE78_06525 [Bacteroidetes bacterium]|nr:hypothetical protein [Bacteroidota bacterium]
MRLKLYSLVNSTFKIISLAILTVVLISCSTSNTGQYQQLPGQDNEPLYQQQFTVPGQTLPGESIRSVQLYQGSPGQAPIIELNTSQSITLNFDDLNFETDMFRVEITHHNADWSDSGLLPNFYLQGFHTDYFGEGRKARPQNPQYLSYSYSFPNQQMKMTRSGNYLLHVYRQHNNQKLFSIPFLVHENEGSTELTIEELFNQDARYLRHHQPFANYKYEDNSIIPQSDMSVFFVQNQFWGKAMKADQVDFSEQYNARLYLSRDKAFIGAYEFFDLGLGNIDQYSSQIVDYDLGFSIPSVTLERDVINLELAPRQRASRLTSIPSRSVDARYALVDFQLEIPENEIPFGEIYVIGSFNMWGINPANKMTLNPATGLFTGQAIIKEGQYAYKYVVLQTNRIDDTMIDASFASTRHEYHALVYLRDMNFQVDRLVSVGTIQSN